MTKVHDIIIIDNYDSFTWNIVQLISEVTDRKIDVYRNDKITIKDLQRFDPRLLVISPGPGHPELDAGISSEAIRSFAGHIPIMGVCMGQQCMFTVFGGKVEQTGEILHGKTSPVKHDGKGIYAGVRQDINVTRYHSLAGTKATLPDCLESTCWTESGVIMGVRHKTYAIEGVQFHPESYRSEEGEKLFANFLKIKAGTWAEHERLEAALTSEEKSNDVSIKAGISEEQERLQRASRSDMKSNYVSVKSGTLEGQERLHTASRFDVVSDVTNGQETKKSILETIHEQRLIDIAGSKAIPGTTPEDLQTLLKMNIAPSLIDFAVRLRQNQPEPAIMAEIKRASPSKGDIDLSANAAKQALLYARGRASVISVLTEPKWFKGSLNDLRAARDALTGLPNRPALLRKDFIIDRYQIDEARVYGADTILLIVAMLSKEALRDLYEYAKTLGMEPLVEVNNQREMKLAIDLGAKVIGVNNRNLHDFVVDLETTSRLAKDLADGVTLCALSGITGREDVVKYVNEGVGAVLVGEALMRSADKARFVDELLGKNRTAKVQTKTHPLVKICGTRTVEAAKVAANAGADLIGLIFAEGRRRTVSVETASEIVAAVRANLDSAASLASHDSNHTSNDWFSLQLDVIRSSRKPLFVGVFQNQSLATILHAKVHVPLDIVQLHGDEPLEWCQLIPGPVFRAFDTTEPALSKVGLHSLALLDATSECGVKGGSGTTLDWSNAKAIISSNQDLPVILAGGLNPENVREALQSTGAIGVDVSSGVETDGEQDLAKIESFIRNAKST